MENGQSYALRACEALALRARKTLTPRFTDFFTDFDQKNDCFAVYYKVESTWDERCDSFRSLLRAN